MIRLASKSEFQFISKVLERVDVEVRARSVTFLHTKLGLISLCAGWSYSHDETGNCSHVVPLGIHFNRNAGLFLLYWFTHTFVQNMIR